ncbi:hypothetical protein [Paenibacillus sp. NPDC055715]
MIDIVKKLHTLAYLLIFIDAQLQQHLGLRDILADIQHHEGFHSELGMDSISTSQLSRKNNKVSPELLREVVHRKPLRSSKGRQKISKS